MSRSPSKKSSINTVRIIAGQWRGRKLPVADLAGLRPTGDRVRETLFNWLAPNVAGANCLDLFAGSGALGLEALSRGAAHVTALDSSRDAVSSLTDAGKLLGATGLQVVQIDALQWISDHSDGLFDIVFIDPPFQSELLDEVVMLLSAANCLAPEALIYIERDRDNSPLSLPNSWRLCKDKVTGNVSYSLYELKSRPE